MERDPKLSKLIRESGLIDSPVSFTDQVMNKITAERVKNAYKPLIGRGGKILILLFIIGVVAYAIFFLDPGGQLFENAGRLSNVEWKLPQIDFSVDFLSEINFSTWLVSTIVALFFLVLSDAVLHKRRRRLV